MSGMSCAPISRSAASARSPRSRSIAAAPAEGEPVARIERPDDNDSWDCKAIGEALAQEIETNPSAFYVEVRTEEFPNGAIRGQLGPG